MGLLSMRASIGGPVEAVSFIFRSPLELPDIDLHVLVLLVLRTAFTQFL